MHIAKPFPCHSSQFNHCLFYFQFVAHPNVQQLLASIWYEGLPGFRQMNMFLQTLEVCRIGLLFPFFSLAYIVFPCASFSLKLRKPFIKFICTSASYFTFLCEWFKQFFAALSRFGHSEDLVLYILTRVFKLRTPNAGQNLLFPCLWHFCKILIQKLQKRVISLRELTSFKELL